MLEYLRSAGFTKAVEAFQEESAVEPDPKSAGLLEKKWTSVLRLQKKVQTRTSSHSDLDLPTLGVGSGKLTPREKVAAGCVRTGRAGFELTNQMHHNSQIMELENKVTQLQEEVDKGGGGAAKKQTGENIPRPPCKYTLSGHRNNINSVRYPFLHA